jgi:competence protein ComEC
MPQKRKGKKRILAVLIAVAVIVAASALLQRFLPSFSKADDYVSSVYNEVGQSLGLTEGVDDGLYVRFIDVGQGDCELIVCDGKVMLIDAGEFGNETKVINTLKGLGIKTIDYAVATHPHSDHIGALAEVLAEFTVRNYLTYKLPAELVPDAYYYTKLVCEIEEAGANTVYAKPGMIFMLGGAKVTVVGPVDVSDNLNNMSIVLRVDYGNTSYLFEGDAEREEELGIIASGADVDCDVLKIGHHGGDSSTSDEYLKAVTPGIAVISCGKSNDYGHPHDTVLRRLSLFTENIYRTDIYSDIVVSSDGKTYKVTYADK